MQDLKVSSMAEAAARAIKRATGTTGGTEIWVGYNGKCITAGDPSSCSSQRVKKSLPHIRVVVMPTDIESEVEMRLALAVLQLRKELPAAIAKAKAKPKPSPKPDRGHRWARKGANGRKGS